MIARTTGRPGQQQARSSRQSGEVSRPGSCGTALPDSRAFLPAPRCRNLGFMVQASPGRACIFRDGLPASAGPRSLTTINVPGYAARRQRNQALTAQVRLSAGEAAQGHRHHGLRAVSPVTRQSGKKTMLVRNDRLADALHGQAQSALRASPGARAYYDEQRERGLDHDAALGALSNRLVGILHGCLKTRTLYDEATAWSHRVAIPAAA